MPRPDKSVADLMRAWRVAAGLTREQAGSALNLSPRTIEDIEHGRSRADDVLARAGLEKMLRDAQNSR